MGQEFKEDAVHPLTIWAAPDGRRFDTQVLAEEYWTRVNMPLPNPITVAYVVERYLALRYDIEEVGGRYAAELGPINRKQEVLENWLLNQLNTSGVDSMRTEAGTAYKTTAVSVTIADREAFLTYVLEPAAVEVLRMLEGIGIELTPAEADQVQNILKTYPAWDETDIRAGKKGILAKMEETKKLPPGLNSSSFAKVNVRKS